jgi:thiol-disulfide isomerase/thioredoxin
MKIEEIKTKITSALGNKQVLLVLFIAIIFLIAAVYTYRRYVHDRINKEYVANNEFSKGDGTSAEIYFFYTTWCPHCKTAKPIWNSLKTELTDKPIKGVKLNFIEVDCDKDTTTSDKFNVKGFPTIKMVIGNKVIEYDAKPSKENLLEFVKSSLA